MSYASALLNVSTEERVENPSKQQPKPQQNQPQKPQSELPNGDAPVQRRPVQSKLEGNNGGDIGQLLTNEKKDGSILVCLLSMAGPATSANLSRTCKYLDNLIVTKNGGLFNKMYKHKTDKLKVVFTVDFAEVKGEVKRLPVSSFSRQRQKALTKYWKRVVNEAQDARDASKDDKSLLVNLRGGFVLSETDKERNDTDVILQNDLSQTVNWLKAIISLLNGKKTQTISLSNGTVVFTRYGLGGTRICVEVKLPNSYTVRRYDFGKFCLEVRDAVKLFIPIVGSCAVGARNDTNVPAGDNADRVLECEKVFTQVLMHDSLRNCSAAIKQLLKNGAVPRSRVWLNRVAEKAKIENQKRIEDENIYNFLLNNIPDDFEKVEEQKRKLTAEAEQKRNQERQEKERARLAKLNKTEEGETTPSAPKHKIKKYKEVDDNGFTVEKAYIIKETGGKVEKESIDLVPKESTEVVTKQKEKPVSALDSNPFSAFLMEGQFASINETQPQRNKGRVVSEDKSKSKKGNEKANVNQKNKKQAPTPTQTQTPTSTQTQTPKPRKAQKPAAKSKAGKKKADVRNNKQMKNVATKQKEASLFEHELFQPSLIALAVVGFAVGYMFLFNATPL